jgi:hypothetical protein
MQLTVATYVSHEDCRLSCPLQPMVCDEHIQRQLTFESVARCLVGLAWQRFSANCGQYDVYRSRIAKEAWPVNNGEPGAKAVPKSARVGQEKAQGVIGMSGEMPAGLGQVWLACVWQQAE